MLFWMTNAERPNTRAQCWQSRFISQTHSEEIGELRLSTETHLSWAQFLTLLPLNWTLISHSSISSSHRYTFMTRLQPLLVTHKSYYPTEASFQKLMFNFSSLNNFPSNCRICFVCLVMCSELKMSSRKRRKMNRDEKKGKKKIHVCMRNLCGLVNRWWGW